MSSERRSTLPKMLTVDMPDGSVWAVPVMLIARNRAEHYKREFGDDIERSLAEDTIPLFSDSDYEIRDWACNNLNWSDVSASAIKVREPKPMTADDMQDAWCNGDMDVTY